MEKSLSSSEIDIVRTHLSSVLVKESDRITLPETYHALKDKFPGAVENIFIGQLNKAIKENKLPGMTIVRGRYGGIRLEKPGLKPVVPTIKPPVVEKEITIDIPDVEVVEEPPNEELYKEMKELIETSTKPVVVESKVKTSWGASPAPTKKDLWMNGRHYQIPHTINEVKDLLEKVLEVKEDPEGAIKFDGQTYSCSELAMEFFDRFLFYFYGAHLVIETMEK
ncbi:MAG TPA: hypothetical protein VM577_14350 [Anaerovoracaceae bacterium]|nr:hypothetical protein [Anaerovoracaceae bacterium]